MNQAVSSARGQPPLPELPSVTTIDLPNGGSVETSCAVESLITAGIDDVAVQVLRQLLLGPGRVGASWC